MVTRYRYRFGMEQLTNVPRTRILAAAFDSFRHSSSRTLAEISRMVLHARQASIRTNATFPETVVTLYACHAGRIQLRPNVNPDSDSPRCFNCEGAISVESHHYLGYGSQIYLPGL